MGKIRRGGYIFITWTGDHTPRHVHVYRESQFVVKWDLENEKPMKGSVSQKVVDLIRQLQAEGEL